VAGWASAFPGAEIAAQLPQLRQLLSRPGKNPEDALQELWGEKLENAPPGLVAALKNHLALRVVSPAAHPVRRSPDAIVSAFIALGYALSARMILLLAMVGAFVLGTLAMSNPTQLRLFMLIAYACFTVIPVALLEAFGKRPKDD
jgi:hypothetical protein